MRILLTNDDGIDALGLAVLEEIAKNFSTVGVSHPDAPDIWIVAPDKNCSGSGRSVTLKKDLTTQKHAPQRYSCTGTPTDCMIYALNHLMRDAPPDLVLSGVNFGRNVSDDITCSGTIGAAWEAAICGIPAIALSQQCLDITEPPNLAVFDSAITHAPTLIKKLCAGGWQKGIVMNINFPSVSADAVEGVKAVGLGHHKISDEISISDTSIPDTSISDTSISDTSISDTSISDTSISDTSTADSSTQVWRIGRQYHTPNLDPESDAGALAGGYITVTPLAIDMADYGLIDGLNKELWVG